MMTETYVEVVRRNEPKNYTVRWSLVDGKTENAYLFESFEAAELYAYEIKDRDFVQDVFILRAGRHPSSSRWLSPKRTKARLQRKENGVYINEDAWLVPAGYVDGDADKHGPVVMPELSIKRLPVRTDAEKGEWAKNNPLENKTCLWQ